MENEYIKNSAFYKNNVLSCLDIFDLSELIEDKYAEILGLKMELAGIISEKFEGHKSDRKEVWKLIYKDKIAEIERVINLFRYTQNSRKANFDKTFITIDELKSRMGISEVIELIAGVEIKKGKLIKCPLPTHNDKTSSFKVYENNDKRHCFGCHAGGDIINFVAEYKQISLKEAIKELKQNIR